MGSIKKSKKLNQDKLLMDEDAKLMAKLHTENVLNAAITIKEIYNKKLDFETLVQNINKQAEGVLGGHTVRVELMLMTQAQTLDALFHNMIVKMANSELLVHLQTYADLALKAQNQSRQTLAVLAELKHPKRTTFIKQQNNAINQQVNSNSSQKNIEKRTNELLNEDRHAKMDFRRTIETSGINSSMEAMEKVNRSEER